MEKKMYAVIDCRADEWFEDFYETEAEAISAGERDWDHLTYHDQLRRTAFYVASVKVTYDENGDMEDYEVINVIREYK